MLVLRGPSKVRGSSAASVDCNSWLTRARFQGYAVDSRASRCSSLRHEAVSCGHGRFHGYVSGGGRVLGISEHRAPAGWILMFALRERGLLEEGPWPFRLPRVRIRGFSPGGHAVSGHAQAASPLVSGDVVCGEPEERRQRAGAAKGAGPWQLLHRMGMVAQAAPCHGPARPRQAVRHCRSGRDFPWRPAPEWTRAWSRR